MKNITVFIFLTLILFSNFSHADVRHERNYVQECYKILSDLDGLFREKHKEDEDAKVFNTVKEGIRLFSTRKFTVRVNDEDKTTFGKMSFQFSTDSSIVPYILIGTYMIELYQTKPSIVLSALIHEMKHAVDYFTNTNMFIRVSTLKLEHFLFELDAYNIEANFIKYYLLPNNYKVTKFEKFLSKSFDEDYLSNFSFCYYGESMEEAMALYGLAKKKISYEEKIKLINDRLEFYIDQKLVTSGSDWDKYKQMVPVFSFVRFGEETLYMIDSIHGKIDFKKEYRVLYYHPELSKKFSKLADKFNNNKDMYNKYLDEFQDLLNKDE